MIIRLATPNDFPNIARLRWDFKIEDGEVAAITREQFEQQCCSKLQKESAAWAHFLAVEHDDPIGMVSICKVPKILSPNLKSDLIGYLTNTYVVPSMRNRNIGDQLLKFAIDWVKQQHIELLFVWPSDRSRSFYSRLGFKAENDIMELLF